MVMLFLQYSDIFETIDHRQSYNVQNISCRIRRKIFRPFIYFPTTVLIFVTKTTSANTFFEIATHIWKIKKTHY
jgi:hypothetical protein